MVAHTRQKPPSADSRKPTAIILVPLLLTLCIRLWFILEVRHLPFSTVSPQIVDSWAYHRWALTIIQGNFWGSDVFFLRPIYPYLLALFYAVFGQKVIAIQIFQTIIASISCYLLFQIAARLFNRTVATLTGIGFALCGVLVFYTGTLSYVEITIFFSLCTLYLLLIAGNRWWRFALAGICFGLFVICRPEMLTLLPLLIIWHNRFLVGSFWSVVRERRTLHPELRTIFVFALSALLVVGSVPIRNALVARDAVVFTAHSGINFYFGNNPSADGTWQPASGLNQGQGFSHQRLKRVVKFVNGKELTWSQASNYWIKQGLKFIFSHPGKFLKLLVRKFLLFFANYEIPNNYYPETVRPVSLALKLAFINAGIIIAFALFGIILSWSKRRQLVPLYLFAAGYLFSALLFYVLSRLRAPVLPFLLPFAGFAVTRIVEFFRQGQLKKLIFIVSGALVIYLITNLIPIKRNTYAAQGWTQLGNIYLEEKRVEPAINALLTALKLDSANPSAKFSLVQAYTAIRRVPEAEQELRQLHALIGNVPEAQPILHLAAARIAIARRDFHTAIKHYETVLALDPENAEASYLLGLVYISVKDLENAEKYLALALHIDSSHDAARAALAEVKRHRL